MPPAQLAPKGADEARRRRRYTAAYKARIAWQYAGLDKAGRTELLRSEGLRASLVRQWLAQAQAAVLQALSGEPGGQPARRIHVSEALWAELTEAGAALDPPISPERLIRALCSWYVGRDAHPPARPGRKGTSAAGAT